MLTRPNASCKAAIPTPIPTLPTGIGIQRSEPTSVWGGTGIVAGTLNADPFSQVANPNDFLDFDMLDDGDPLKDIRVNATNSGTLSDSKSISADGTLQVNRKLNNKGRNITFRGRFGYGDNDNNQYTESMTRYYQIPTNPDSMLIRNQFITTPTKN